MNKLFLLVLLVVVVTSITFGLTGTSITFDGIETKSETKKIRCVTIANGHEQYFFWV